MLAGFVQGLTGFGFALTAMPIWAWAVEPRTAAVLSVTGGLAGQILGAFFVRRGFAFARLAPFIAGGLAGLPIGLWLLPRLDVALFKLLLGAFLVVVCPLMLWAERLPRIAHGGRLADGAMGMMGGVMGALGGFTGAVPSLWCTLRAWDKDTQRGVIQNFNLAMLAVTFASYAGAGVIGPAQAKMIALALPAAIVPSLVGARLYMRISQVAFRRTILALLTGAGATLLVAALPVLHR